VKRWRPMETLTLPRSTGVTCGGASGLPWAFSSFRWAPWWTERRSAQRRPPVRQRWLRLGVPPSVVGPSSVHWIRLLFHRYPRRASSSAYDAVSAVHSLSRWAAAEFVVQPGCAPPRIPGKWLFRASQPRKPRVQNVDRLGGGFLGYRAGQHFSR
jgi:hypothetical protein